MATSTVSSCHDARHVAALLGLPEIKQLIADLDETRWTGRPGFPVRVMVGAFLIKAVYAIPTWTRTARLVAEHAALREVVGGAPSNWACYRFGAKLRDHGDMLTACLDRVLAALHEAHPEMGQTVAIDGSDMLAYANGHKHVGNKNGPLRTRFSDPDAGWGHRSSISTRKGGAYYGFKLHMAICTQTELPLAWTVRAANEPEQGEVPGLLDSVMERGFATQVAVLDKGYDGQPMHDECESRGIRPVIALKETPLPSRPASTSRRRASTASGRSPGPTPSAARPSGGAPRPNLADADPNAYVQAISGFALTVTGQGPGTRPGDRPAAAGPGRR
jgi:hypothetical protein